MASFPQLEFPTDGTIAAQLEFPLKLVICAWCRPVGHASEYGLVSHGICLRHLRKLKLQATGKLPKRSRKPSREDESGLATLRFSF